MVEVDPATGAEVVGPYKLRTTLLGHSSDVRCLAVGRTEGDKEFVVSGSRDKTAKIWMPAAEVTSFTQLQCLEGHKNFVSSVHTIPPCERYPQGLVLTGSNDATILGFEIGKSKAIFCLRGHSGTVCSLGGTDLIVSGSWDHSARVWDDQTCLATLQGHTAAVWAVAMLPLDDKGARVLTASADKEVRLWTNFKLTRSFRGHEDCVRALAVVDSTKFLSGSNDSSVRMWDVESGESLQTFYGHQNFIYSIAMMPDHCGFVSVGEDRTLRIWRGSDMLQAIYHPATSVWTVNCLANGDIVTGSSDGSVRIFTQDESRMASPEELTAFEEEVSKSVIATQNEIGGMKISELPGPESLLIPGKSDGQTKMVREGDKVSCFSWSAMEKKWSKIGDVVGASGATQGTSGKVLFEGIEFDYVFNVDVEDKVLKLPYNVTQDPWIAAQTFIHKHELPQSYLDQVANFIMTNSKGMQLGVSNSSNDFADPFTGGNRYVPGTENPFLAPGAGGGTGGLDPFTGSGAYTTSSAFSSQTSAPRQSVPCFPVSDFLKFTAAPNYDGLRKKVEEFMSQTGHSFDPQLLLDVGKSATWSASVENIVKDCLANWPAEKIFPVLDLLRLGVMNEDFAKKLNSAIPVVSEFPGKFMLTSFPTAQMLTLRLLSNCFGPLTKELMTDRHIVLSQLMANLCFKTKGNEVAGATVILNYAIGVTGANMNSPWATNESQTEVLMHAFQLLEQLEDAEAVYRTLVAVGNLVSDNPATANLFSTLGGESVLNVLQGNLKENKVKDCCAQVLTAVKKAGAMEVDAGPSNSMTN